MLQMTALSFYGWRYKGISPFLRDVALTELVFNFSVQESGEGNWLKTTGCRNVYTFSHRKH